MESGRPSQQLRVITQLIQAGHWPNVLSLSVMTTDPMDVELHLLTLALYRDDNPLHQLPDNRLTISGRSRVRLPKRWQITGEPPNGLALARRERRGLLS
jgi:hypothetical protein